MTKAERQAALEAARNVLLKALPDAWAIYLYGSFARGDEWPDSDVDFGVLLPPGQQIADKLSLMAQVSRVIQRDVDLVDLRHAGLLLAREVLRDGQLLVAPQPDATLAWEAERMTDYSDFAPRCQSIVDLYVKQPLRKSA